jgi:hypothetical protein
VRTDDLVALLAAGGGAVDRGATRRRFALALSLGGAGTLLLMAVLMGVRPDLPRMALEPMFWTKLGYCAALSVAALSAVARLARPGARAARATATGAVPLALMWLLAALALDGAAGAERDALVFGTTWRACAVSIAFLSLPLFGALLWALRGLAPTRLALAGAAAGFLSGAAASLIYCLHCPELGAPFLGIWYPLGMLIPAAAGAVLGPKLLRW